jgi:hypothetical protein
VSKNLSNQFFTRLKSGNKLLNNQATYQAFMRVIALITILVLVSSIAFAEELFLTTTKNTGMVAFEKVDTTTAIGCGAKFNVQPRIQCRLETGEAEGVPEACRNLGEERTNACIKLYDDSKECYSKADRDACFKEKTVYDPEDVESVKNYMILLLYELQLMVEESYAEGNLDSYDAANLIDGAIDIKKSILKNRPKKHLTIEISEYKRYDWDRDMVE